MAKKKAKKKAPKKKAAMVSEKDRKEMRKKALPNMHKMFLEALRHREQDIVRFLAILGPSLGGFVWLHGDLADNPARFVAGTYGVLLVLVLGAFYSLALGYNYRYLTLQLAKLESRANLKLEGVVLGSWPRMPSDFKRRNRWGVIPWSTPPGIIKVFWIAFLACIVGVTIAGSSVKLGQHPQGNIPLRQGTLEAMHAEGARQEAMRVKPFIDALPWVGGVSFALGLLCPVSVGKKMLKACRDEDPDEWVK